MSRRVSSLGLRETSRLRSKAGLQVKLGTSRGNLHDLYNILAGEGDNDMRISCADPSLAFSAKHECLEVPSGMPKAPAKHCLRQVAASVAVRLAPDNDCPGGKGKEKSL